MDMQPDLLIKNEEHESALQRTFVTPLDWQLLRQCPIPLHLVASASHSLPRKVVAAVDPSQPTSQFSELNNRIIEQANSLALQCDAELHLLHIQDLPSIYLGDAGDGGLVMSDLERMLRSTVENAFIELANHYGVPAERRHFLLGAPVSSLTDFAEQHQIDVIVMGRVHHNGLRKLIGSTTEHLLYQLPSSILAIKG